MRHRLLRTIVCLALLWAAPVYAAATFSSSVTGTNFSGAGTTVSCASVSVSTGDVVFVLFGWRRNAAQSLSSVTFNGSSTGLTAVTGASGQTADGGSGEIGAYVGVGLSGTADVVVTLSANSPVMMVRCVVLSGVNTSTPYGTVVQSTGNDDPSDTATGTTDGLGLDALILRNDDTLTAGAGQSNTSTLGIGNGTQLDSSTKAGAVSLSMTWTGNVNGDAYVYDVIPVIAAAAGGSTCRPGSLALLGVGC